MKDLIIIVGTILLGCLLFQMIAGEENSLRKACADKMEQSIRLYQEEQMR